MTINGKLSKYKYSYWRFMSSLELLNYLKGNDIIRKFSNKGKTNAPINSMFFFDTEVRTWTSNKEITYNIFNVMDFCYGVVSDDYLVKFVSNENIGHSIGQYADCISENYGLFDVMNVEERYVDYYNNNTMILDKVYYIEGINYLNVDFDSLTSDDFVMKEDEIW